MNTVEDIIRECIEEEKKKLCGTKIQHGKQIGNWPISFLWCSACNKWAADLPKCTYCGERFPLLKISSDN